jgi:glycosyltransferase involved in cell wall biosynthesis
MSEGSAAWRILKSQIALGVDSRALVYKSNTTLQTEIISVEKSIFPKSYTASAKLSSALNFFENASIRKSPWSYSVGAPEMSLKQLKQFDLINFHWLPSIVRLEQFAKIEIPIVVTMHDVWPLTGGCHCNLECNQWKTGCRNCPSTSVTNRSQMRPGVQWERKMAAYSSHKKLGFVAPSSWMESMLQASPLTKQNEITKIANCLDPLDFPIRDRAEARKRFGISPEAFCPLFVVSGDLNMYHKGLDLLLLVINEFSSKYPNVQIKPILVGDSSKIASKKELRNSHLLGDIQNTEQLSWIYSSGDVTLSLSRQDNLPNVLIESNVSGIPVLAFDIGGIGDIVDVEKNGILVKAFDISRYVEELYNLYRFSGSISKNEIRDNAVKKYNLNLCAEKYLSFYEEMISG